MFETKEQVLEEIMSQPKPVCCDCGKEMKLWEVPPINFSDGLGWGTPYLYICFNDECPSYKQGWEHMKTNYSHTASYRRMCYPGTEQYELMPVFSPVGGQGQIIDDQVLLQEEMLKEAIKKGFSILAQCYVDKDAETALRLVLDPTEPARVRLKAAEMLGDIGELDAVDPLRNLNVGNRLISEQLEASIAKIHERFFTRECPFCAEIIKKKAKICKHCGKEVAGL
ncbi:MAG: zinc ribbon domain-containing protein [Deltaproteobacteria bacterium]|nr:zinc ribbon domain-containing protein [Deltaproteobacteria bacterium]